MNEKRVLVKSRVYFSNKSDNEKSRVGFEEN